MLTLDHDPATGKLATWTTTTSQAQGLWITCGSSLSPWGTHLSSEEYEPDAFSVADNKVFKSFKLFGDANVATSRR